MLLELLLRRLLLGLIFLCLFVLVLFRRHLCDHLIQGQRISGIGQIDGCGVDRHVPCLFLLLALILDLLISRKYTVHQRQLIPAAVINDDLS